MVNSLNSALTIIRGTTLAVSDCRRGRGDAVQQKAMRCQRGGDAAVQCDEARGAVKQTHISQVMSDETGGLELGSMQVVEPNDVMEASPWPKPLSPLAGEVAKAIELERAMRAEAAMVSQPAFTGSDIIYQDEWILVINKRSGIYAGHVLSTVTSMFAPDAQPAADSSESNRRPGNKLGLGSYPCQAFRSRKPGSPSASRPHFHLANRLDRDTSGVMIVTKCKIVAGKLTRMFQRQQTKKSYVALCIGPRPSWDEVYVETGHGRSRWGAWRVYACEDVGRKLPEKAVVKTMSTHFSVLSVNGERVHDGCCNEKVCEKRLAKRDQPYQNVPAIGDEVLVRAQPLTGRTHQIRLHCQFLGLPLRGDVKYGGPLVWKGCSYDTHTLHAESMSFRHPVTGVHLLLVAPLPMWAAH